MMVSPLAAVLLASLPLATALASSKCANTHTLTSCSSAANAADPCCVPRAGLWLFRQRFEPDSGDHGTWGINNVDILECDGTQPSTPTNKKLSHEEIGSLCARAGFDADHAERAWAQSEVGEGVEEVWERVWNTDGRFVSSICDGDVSRFFSALGRLHESIPTAVWLADADIVPSADIRYRLADLTAALSSGGHAPVLQCDNGTLEAVVYPVHVVGNLAAFAPAGQKNVASSCPSEGIIYPPSAILPKATTTWDAIYRPSMRPITLSHDEARQVKYTDGAGAKKKLGFFKKKDSRRMAGEHGHDEYARDEL